MWIEIVWYIAGIIWVTQAFPQIIKVYKTKKAQDLSYITIVMVIVCTALRSIYWYNISSWPILYPNILLGISYIFLLSIKLRYDKEVIIK
jgi:MtN3 and saliva related transmembrane protein